MMIAVILLVCAALKLLAAFEWAPLYRAFLFVPAKLLAFFYLLGYEENGGVYRFPGFIVDHSCAGIHFFMVAALVTALAVKRSLRGFLTVIAAAYLLTLLANTVRVMLLLTGGDFALGRPWLHEAVGSLVFISFLIIYYTILNFRSQNATQR